MNDIIRNYIRSVLLQEQGQYFQKAKQSGYAITMIEDPDSFDDHYVILYDTGTFSEFLVYTKENGLDPKDIHKYRNDFKKDIAIASVSFYPKKYTCYDHATVASASAVPGAKMGIVAYESALYYATKKWGGLFADRGSVSDSALSVWKKYSLRSDVKKNKFDNIENPQTPEPEDDCKFKDDDVLNYSYSLFTKPAELDELEAAHKIFMSNSKYSENIIHQVLLKFSSKLFLSVYQ